MQRREFSLFKTANSPLFYIIIIIIIVIIIVVVVLFSPLYLNLYITQGTS